MAITIEKHSSFSYISLNGERVLTISTPDGCNDSFEGLNEYTLRWTRKTNIPTDQMKLTLEWEGEPRYFQIPAVNYNGNGWGSGAQYSGYRCGETPWSYAWHRVSIPACTYAENDRFCVALFGEEAGGMSCSIYTESGNTVQELIWPETEAPKTLHKRRWDAPYYGTMDPTDSFSGILMLMPAGNPRERIHDLLDFAWKYFYRDVTMQYTPERIRQLDLLFMRAMWFKRYNGLIGFQNGINWEEESGQFVKLNKNIFEIGWCGQNAAQSCALLDEYLATGDEDAKEKAISVLDSWDENAFLPNGLMYVKLQAKPDHLDSTLSGNIPLDLDTCNLGTAATYFFRAATLCKKAGIDRPSYEKRAFGLCDFFVQAQLPSGELAKSYFVDGSIDKAHGSVAAFSVLPLFDAWERSGQQKYLDAALKGVDFYLDEFMKYGYTTAGALDSNCIDKESAAPLLRAAVRAYEVTKEQKYLDEAVEVAYYLATWQWHYSVDFPEDAQLKKLGVDTYGSTSVSAAHNALDHYGIYYIPEYLKLAELTGNEMWKQRARVLWYNGMQLLSDGTLIVNGRVRPAGSQDEAFRQTRWVRTDNKIFVPSEWCTVWQGTFRHLVLEELDNWDILR